MQTTIYTILHNKSLMVIRSYILKSEREGLAYFKPGTQTEDEDSHHRQGPWPPRSKVKVARLLVWWASILPNLGFLSFPFPFRSRQTVLSNSVTDVIMFYDRVTAAPGYGTLITWLWLQTNNRSIWSRTKLLDPDIKWMKCCCCCCQRLG